SLTTTLTALREIAAQGVDPEKLPGLAAEAMRGESLTHAWLEFKDTLHAEIGPPDEFGGRSTSRYRQTVPVDVFFSPEALVYSPMNAEFFRHFPGMLTATGIVLTFSGLIFGLHEFGITSDINSVADKVYGLIETVGWAFAASALMIIIAVVT